MADTQAFSIPIKPENSGQDENDLVHQSSATWVVTFVRWEFRDTLRTKTDSPTSVRQPMVVENDCMNVTVTYNKGTLTPSVSMTLIQTDINYETAIAPGDFVFVNMLNWETDARRVADQARAQQPINGPEDGFKGIFKVQGVRKSIAVIDQEKGTKALQFKIDGFAFTEFNNTVYFNPNLINQKNLQNQALFISDIAPAWASYVSRSGKPHIQDVIAFLIQNLIGVGINPKARVVGGLVVSPNTHFLVPQLVGRLLGVVNTDEENSKDFKSAIAAKDVYQYLFGLQKYASGENQTIAQGMNPANLKDKQEYPGFYYTSTFCQGQSLLKPEYWNQVKVWSILNQYTNSPLNELYTCFRISKFNRVMPTVVFRQIPFTSEDFSTQKFGTQDSKSGSIAVTKFLSLPRWKIDSAFVLGVDIGRDEAARINFVQYYAKSNFSDKGIETSGETALVNYVFDKDDIKRSGLRPYIVQNQFDDVPDALIKSAPVWARILGDAVIGGHLKLNGTLNCPGIIDPIAVGDNLEFDNVVYHIEQITHACVMSGPGGSKTFRTSISVSHGVSINSDSEGTKYAEMEHVDADGARKSDAENQQIMPGVSESQDVVYRPKNPEFSKPIVNPFPQPSLIKNKPRTGE